ncbi:MAG: hypothetical protein JW994_05090 [Candidatus Omnitrophica bacterium]|nr:hypothetical protein [Candidatus Omnitrophota bacterium]
MKFRTIIEIVSDAENEHEAMDVAGEFLRGNLESGIEMKCHTKPLTSHIFSRLIRWSAFFVLLTSAMGLLALSLVKNPPVHAPIFKNFSACPAPLKTAGLMGFRKIWSDAGNEKVLEYVKQR